MAALTRSLIHAFLIVCVGAFGVATSTTSADVLVYPTRLVLEEGVRAAKLELVNRGNQATTFRVSLVNRRMDEFGAFSPADAPQPDERFATELIRYSPRQVTIEPGQAQTIRLAVRKPANLEPGEYRSHLLFSRQPEARGSSSIEDLSQKNAGGIEVRLETLIGVSIPVIVRHGKLAARVALSNLTLESPSPEQRLLRFDIARSGEQSVYGDLSVALERSGEETVIARARGVAVYHPNTLRVVRFDLAGTNWSARSGDRITVRFTTPVNQGESELAAATMLVP